MKADGTVAIGPGGGTIADPATGAELRVPPGALAKGVELKVKGLSAGGLEAKFPGQSPVIARNQNGDPVGHVGSGREITSKDKPTFEKEIDLVFPLPDFTSVPEAERPAKPEDAYYYVVRRIEGPVRRVPRTEILPSARSSSRRSTTPSPSARMAGRRASRARRRSSRRAGLSAGTSTAT